MCTRESIRTDTTTTTHGRVTTSGNGNVFQRTRRVGRYFLASFLLIALVSMILERKANIAFAPALPSHKLTTLG